MSAPVVVARRVLHPGHARPDRVSTAVSPVARRALVLLPEGETLKAALARVFAAFGVRAGAFHLLGGRLSVAAYHVALPDKLSERAVEYGPATDIAGGATILRATGSFGEDLAGNALLHIHGGLSDKAGRTHGGHMNPGLCVIGAGGIRAILMLTVGFKQGVDRETHFSLFFPCSEMRSSNQNGIQDQMAQSRILEIATGRVASVRLGPNEDLLDGLEQAASQLGFRRALVRSGLGSLTDAAFAGEAGEPRHLRGPAIEILAITGEISLDDDTESGAACVSGLVGDTNGAVWSGRFLPGQNPVCVTVEAVLEEIVVQSCTK